jgi:hypothetical protein
VRYAKELGGVFGTIALPGWLLLAWSVFWGIVDWLGRLQLLHDYWPFLKKTAEQIAPSNVNVPVFALSLVWVLGFCFVLPPLARKWGRPGKAIAGLMTSVGAVALLIGILQGQDEIDKINRNYHMTHPAGSHSTQSGH